MELAPRGLLIWTAGLLVGGTGGGALGFVLGHFVLAAGQDVDCQRGLAGLALGAPLGILAFVLGRALVYRQRGRERGRE